MNPLPASEQLALPVMSMVEPEPLDPEATIGERFEAFHAANPWVYETLEKLTADWIARGKTRIGMKMLVEVLRWQYGRTTTDSTPFKLNNNYTSRYARQLIAEHPEWAGAFETRALVAA